MKSPCCRLINLLDEKKITLMKNGAESDGIFRNNSQKNIKEGTNFGWNMINEKEGYPCEKLGINGCSIYKDRPQRCHNFPNTKKLLSKLPNCTMSFNNEGELIGICNGCDNTIQRFL